MKEQYFNNLINTFFVLVKAGLWETEAKLSPFNEINYMEIYRMAEEQSVVGVVAAGIEHVVDVKVPQEVALNFAVTAIQLEQRNKAMNQFIGVLIEKLRSADIYTLLVKGQGMAQCYERPLWRAAGDVDLYLSESNYEKAQPLLISLADKVDNEDKRRLHLGLTIDGWLVELHGTMHTNISRKMNLISDEVHRDIFYNGNVRSWKNGVVQVFLPNPDNDVIIIFNHFINHFYGEGIGLRQICDWCRLLWTYRKEISRPLLEKRIRKMGLMTEWKAFAALAVNYLGMPEESMPFYTRSMCYKKKAEKICRLVLETGNFGHNKDESYRMKYSGLTGHFITAWKRFKEFARIAMIFPCNAPKFYVTYLINRFRAVA